MAKKLLIFNHSLVEGFHIAHSALMANKTRSILTTLGIVIGVVTVTLMMMIIQGLNKSFTDQISFLGSNTLYVERYPWIWDEDWWKYRNRPRITMEHFEQLRDRVTLAESVSLNIWTGRPVAFRDKALDRVGIMGTDANMVNVSNIVPEVGRFITDADNRASRKICVIGKDVQRELFGSINPVNRNLRIGGKTFKVVGILEKQGSTFGQSRDNLIIIPANTLLNNYGFRRSIDIIVKGYPEIDQEELIDELTGLMRSIRSLKPLDENNFSINDQSALYSFYKTMTTGVYATGLIIGGIALLVGGIGIMNIMLVSVTERTWEIGMRKAVGAKTTHIMWQFLVEAMLICMFGGAIGIGLAYLGGLGIKNALPAVLPPWLAASAVLFSATVGLVFGLFPAAKAAKLDPIVALRAK
jgi:putative ABC transport system permease protein